MHAATRLLRPLLLALAAAACAHAVKRLTVTTPGELVFAIEQGDSQPRALAPTVLIAPEGVNGNLAQPWSWFATSADPAEEYPWVYTVPSSGALVGATTIQLAFNASALKAEAPYSVYTETLRFGINGSPSFTSVSVKLTVTPVSATTCTSAAIKNDCFACLTVSGGGKCFWCNAAGKVGCLALPASNAKCSSSAFGYDQCPDFANTSCAAQPDARSGAATLLTSIGDQDAAVQREAEGPIKSQGVCNDGTCNLETGLCECPRTVGGGSFGRTCSVACDRNTTCSGHGSCTLSGACACDEGFSGKKCSDLQCPSVSGGGGVCNGLGDCDKTTGECECDDGVFGAACTCSAALCNGGSCNEEKGTCICPPGKYGEFCEYSCTRIANCGSHGECAVASDFGSYQCTCDEHFFGPTCTSFCDPAVTCSGNGTCSKAGLCVCNESYQGADCAVYVQKSNGFLDNVKVASWFGLVVGVSAGLVIIALFAFHFSDASGKAPAAKPDQQPAAAAAQRR